MTSPFRPIGLLLLGGLFAIIPCSAATVTLLSEDATGTSSFNSAGNWSNGAAPSSGNDYVVSNRTLRTPNVSGSFTFGGSTLTLNNNAVLAYKGGGASDVITVNSLILNGGLVSNWSGLATYPTVAGNISLLSGGGRFDINSNSGISVTSSISGVGALTISSMTGVSQATNAILLKSANLYQGGTVITSYAYLNVQADGGLGLGNVTLNGGLLKLELGATNNYIADTARLLLSSSLGAGAVNLAFTGSDTIAGLSFDGGSTLAEEGTWGAVGSGAQHTSSLFTGSGLLVVVPEPHPSLLVLGGFLLLGVLMKKKGEALS